MQVQVPTQMQVPVQLITLQLLEVFVMAQQKHAVTHAPQLQACLKLSGTRLSTMHGLHQRSLSDLFGSRTQLSLSDVALPWRTALMPVSHWLSSITRLSPSHAPLLCCADLGPMMA